MASDRKLIERIAAGEDDVFANLVEPYRGELLHFAKRQLGRDSQHAEDVLQQALFSAFQALSMGTHPENLRAWLFAIVRNGATNARRSMRTSEPLEGADQAAPQPTVHDRAEQGEWIDWLMGAIGGLPSRQRDVLVGHVFEGLSQQEIAAREETTVLAVKTLLHRARSRLRELRDESLLSVSYLFRGRLVGAKASLGVVGQVFAAAAVTSAVVLAIHGSGVGPVPAAGATPRAEGTAAIVSRSRSRPRGRRETSRTRRVRREAHRATVACLHGKSLSHDFSPSALRYAVRHLSADLLEYTECEGLLLHASLGSSPATRQPGHARHRRKGSRGRSHSRRPEASRRR